MIFLDTHPLIWFTFGEDRLGISARNVMLKAIENGEAWVSPISFWETSMLAEKGRVVFGQPVGNWTNKILDGGVRIATLTSEIAIAAGQLPDSIHGDPADRIIIATARALGCPLVTADRQIIAYARDGHLNVVDARR